MVEITESNLVSVNIDVPKRARATAKDQMAPKIDPKTAVPESLDMSNLLP